VLRGNALCGALRRVGVAVFVWHHIPWCNAAWFRSHVLCHCH